MQEPRANGDTRGLTRASGRFRPVTSRERLVDDLGDASAQKHPEAVSKSVCLCAQRANEWDRGIPTPR